MVCDNEREGRPVSINTITNWRLIETLVLKDCQRMARELATCTRMSHKSVYSILHKLGMWKMCTKSIPRVLIVKQKASCVEMRITQQDAILFSLIITGDESWIFKYDP